jgi:hypothetical protein
LGSEGLNPGDYTLFAPVGSGLTFLNENFLLRLRSRLQRLSVILAFCHFLALMQESNQRKSRKNNASPRKRAITHPAIGKIAELRFATVLSSSRAWYFVF